MRGMAASILAGLPCPSSWSDIVRPITWSLALLALTAHLVYTWERRKEQGRHIRPPLPIPAAMMCVTLLAPLTLLLVRLSSRPAPWLPATTRAHKKVASGHRPDQADMGHQLCRAPPALLLCRRRGVRAFHHHLAVPARRAPRIPRPPPGERQGGPVDQFQGWVLHFGSRRALWCRVGSGH